MVTFYNDVVIVRSKKYTDVTVNASTMYTKNTLTGLYDVVAAVVGKVRELGGEISIYPMFNLSSEELAQQACKQFVKDVQVMSLNQPMRYRAYLTAMEKIAGNLPEDVSGMEKLFIMFSIPKKYLKEDNVFTYRN